MNNEELVYEYQSGNKKALDELIENNKGIVIKIVNHYYLTNKTVEIEDLEQAGYVGLINAAIHYDFNNPKRAKFITFAVCLIEREIKNLLFGRSKKERLNNELYNGSISLETPIGDDDSDTIKDFIADKDDSYYFIEEKLWLDKLKIDLHQCMNKILTLEEREILQLLYGFNFNPLTLEEVGNIFNIKGERVRLKKNRAFRKLRQYPKVKELAEEYLDLDLSSIFDPEVYACREMDLFTIPPHSSGVVQQSNNAPVPSTAHTKCIL